MVTQTLDYFRHSLNFVESILFSNFPFSLSVHYKEATDEKTK